jgi:hypothetical protein
LVLKVCFIALRPRRVPPETYFPVFSEPTETCLSFSVVTETLKLAAPNRKRIGRNRLQMMSFTDSRVADTRMKGSGTVICADSCICLITDDQMKVNVVCSRAQGQEEKQAGIQRRKLSACS